MKPSPPPDHLLLARMMGALEPGEALSTGEALLLDPHARLREGSLAFLAGVDAHRSAAVAASLVAPNLLGLGHPRVGDRVTLRVVPEAPPQLLRAVLFRTCALDLQLLHPLPGRTWPALDRFRREGPSCLLEVVLEAPAGLHTYEIVLVARDLFEEAWPRPDPRWSALLTSFRRGVLPGARLSVEVAAA